MALANNIQINALEPRLGTCYPPTYQDFIIDLTKRLFLSSDQLKETVTTFGAQEPSIEDRDKYWFKLTNGGFPCAIKVYQGTSWKTFYNPLPNERRTLISVNNTDIPIGWTVNTGLSTAGTTFDWDIAIVDYTLGCY